MATYVPLCGILYTDYNLNINDKIWITTSASDKFHVWNYNMALGNQYDGFII